MQTTVTEDSLINIKYFLVNRKYLLFYFQIIIDDVASLVCSIHIVDVIFCLNET